MGENPYTGICTDGDKLARLIVRYGFRQGVIKLADDFRGCGPSELRATETSAFTLAQEVAIRDIIANELRGKAIKLI